MPQKPVAQAIILAAGQGRRLSPLTQQLPKPLIHYFGYPLIDWAITSALRAGVTRIAVNTHHLADKLNAHLQAKIDASLRSPLSHKTIELYISQEPQLLGTGGAIAKLKDWFQPGAPFYIINADAVFAESLLALSPLKAPTLMVTRDPKYQTERRILSSPKGGFAGISEEGHQDAFTFCGVSLADPELPYRLPSGPSCVLRQGFLPYLKELPIRLYETKHFFSDTGTPQRLIEAHHYGKSSMTTFGPPHY